MASLLWSGCLLVPGLLLGAMPSTAVVLRFSDGNGNRYVLGGGSLEYVPVSPKDSSSGVYSGGEPMTAPLGEAAYAELLELFQKALSSRAVAPTRGKGTYLLAWTEDNKAKQRLLEPSSSEARALEAALQDVLSAARTPRTYAVSRDTSPWAGMTGSALEEARTRHLVARAFPREGFEAIPGPAAAWKGQPVLYRSPTEVAVDERFFSALERVDATRLKAGERRVVGAAAQPALLAPEFLLPFLLHAHVVITLWHTDAELRLERTERRGQLQCHVLKGEHHYYTNTRNTGPLHFSICTDASSRQVHVIGE